MVICLASKLASQQHLACHCLVRVIIWKRSITQIIESDAWFPVALNEAKPIAALDNLKVIALG